MAMVMLVADVGGTNTRFALVDAAGSLQQIQQYENAAAGSFDELLDIYLRAVAQQPAHAALAVAGPVIADEVFMTNLGWRLSATRLQAQHGIAQVQLLNDFVAMAWASLHCAPADLHAIGGGTAVNDANRAVLGPGTGLGAAGLIRTGANWTAVAGEGGHVTLAGVTETERALIAAMHSQYGHCSAERLLSGPGLQLIYAYFGGTAGSPADITNRARSGEECALQVVEVFAGLLGTVAGDLALTLGARGGVYLTGGILPAIIDLFAQTSFRERFERKGRMAEYLAAIPTWVMTGDEPALHGLAGYLTNNVAYS